MDLENQLRGDAAGAGSARLTERLGDMAPKQRFLERRAMVSGDPYGALKTRVQRVCIAKLGPRLFGGAMASNDLRKQVTDAVTLELDQETETPLSQSDRDRLIRELTADILGYGPHRAVPRGRRRSPKSWSTATTASTSSAFGKIEPTDGGFVDDDHLLRIIDKIVSRVGRRIDESSPMVDARLPDGSRVNAIIPPLSLRRPDADDPQVLRAIRTRSTTCSASAR